MEEDTKAGAATLTLSQAQSINSDEQGISERREGQSTKEAPHPLAWNKNKLRGQPGAAHGSWGSKDHGIKQQHYSPRSELCPNYSPDSGPHLSHTVGGRQGLRSENMLTIFPGDPHMAHQRCWRKHTQNLYWGSSLSQDQCVFILDAGKAWNGPKGETYQGEKMEVCCWKPGVGFLKTHKTKEKEQTDE